MGCVCWPWLPPCAESGADEGARVIPRGLRRGDRRGTDEGGPIGAGVIWVASSPPPTDSAGSFTDPSIAWSPSSWVDMEIGRAHV